MRERQRAVQPRPRARPDRASGSRSCSTSSATRSSSAATRRRSAKREQLDRLPRRLSEAIEQLRDYQFEDDEARAEFERLLEELENIRALEDFQRRYGELFHGPRGARLRGGARADARDGAPASSSRRICWPGDLETHRASTSCAPLLGDAGGAGAAAPAPVPARCSPRRATSARAAGACSSRRRACARSASSRCATSTRACCATAPAAIRPTTAASPRCGPRRPSRTRTATRCTSTSCARSRTRWRASRGTPLRLEPDDFEVYETAAHDDHLDRAAARHELVDELGGPLRRRQEGRAGDGEPDPLALPARLLRHRRLLHPRHRAQAARPARGELEHGRPVHQPAGRPAPGQRAARAAIRAPTST